MSFLPRDTTDSLSVAGQRLPRASEESMREYLRAHLVRFNCVLTGTPSAEVAATLRGGAQLPESAPAGFGSAAGSVGLEEAVAHPGLVHEAGPFGTHFELCAGAG